MQLSQPASYYAAVNSRGGRLVGELNQRFGDPTKKYLVYYDGAVDEPRLCGQSTVAPDQGGRYAYSLVYSQACHADVGTGAITASVVAHELGHNLGAVPPGGPPHACEGDTAHICDDENDLMFPYTRGQGLNAVSLDAGHDDYYAHSGTLVGSPGLGVARTYRLAVRAHGHGRRIRQGNGLERLARDLVPSELLGHLRSRGEGRALGQPRGPHALRRVERRVHRGPVRRDDELGADGGCEVRRAGLRVGGDPEGRQGSRRGDEPPGRASPAPATAARPSSGAPRVQLVAAAAKNSTFNGWTGSCSGKGACAFGAAPGRAVIASFGPAPAFRPPPPKCKPGQHSTKKDPCRK